jgi:hypothetical protein
MGQRCRGVIGPASPTNRPTRPGRSGAARWGCPADGRATWPTRASDLMSPGPARGHGLAPRRRAASDRPEACPTSHANRSTPPDRPRRGPPGCRWVDPRMPPSTAIGRWNGSPGSGRRPVPPGKPATGEVGGGSSSQREFGGRGDSWAGAHIDRRPEFIPSGTGPTGPVVFPSGPDDARAVEPVPKHAREGEERGASGSEQPYAIMQAPVLP